MLSIFPLVIFLKAPNSSLLLAASKKAMSKKNESPKNGVSKYYGYKQRGFTLIEIMLVIAIIAAMTVGGIAMLKKRTTKIKVEKTSLQIQQWLQAGMSYYVSHNRWPDSVDEMKLYVPVGMQVNPWGGIYTISHTDYKFKISTELSHQNKYVAQRVINRLPSGDVQSNGIDSVISAEVNIPGQNSTDPNQPVFKFITRVSANSRISKPQCPDTMVAKIYLSINKFYAPYSGSEAEKDERFARIRKIDTTVIDLGTQWQVGLARYGRADKKVVRTEGTDNELIAIAMCEPKASAARATQSKEKYLF